MWSDLNLDFLAIIAQFAINFALLLGLCIYVLCTYSWDPNT